MRKIKNKIVKSILVFILMVATFANTSHEVYAGNMAPGGTQLAYESAIEGMVLLKNENDILPLNVGTDVAVFGRIQIDTIRGGSGSGAVKVSYSINILDGLRNNDNINVYEPLATVYEEWVGLNPPDTSSSVFGGYAHNQVEMPLDDSVVADAAANTDTAIIVIGRNSGEGEDRANLEGSYSLDSAEKEMLEKVSDNFENVIVLLNIGGPINMDWVSAYDIDSILLVWQPGIEGGSAIADVITGDAYPSGKLVDTFTTDYSNYPASTFLENNPQYTEDIYVGYRYFETFAPNDVIYEFGYGLSYTDFEYEILKYDDSNVIVSGNMPDATISGSITVDVRVSNVGNSVGKEVIQLYYSKPQGKLTNPAYELATYIKTDELQPGERQTVTLTFDVTEMKSYDSDGRTFTGLDRKSAYVLENGSYDIYIGNSVKNNSLAGTYTVDTGTDNPITVEQLTEVMSPTASFDVMTNDGNGNIVYESVVTRSAGYTIDYKLDTLEEYEQTNNTNTLNQVSSGEITIEEFIGSIPTSDLVKMFSGNTSGINGAAGSIGNLSTYGISTTVLADGPAGINVNMTDGIGNTAFPVGSMLASTWNLDLIEQVGEIVGQEALGDGVDYWLAPALNIHRSPIGGRNFEYYSEDPVVSGYSAAAISRGVQSQGVGVIIKHFAAQNQEANRMKSDSQLSERALREIYLKGFEIVVEEANPWGIMSSYNKINGSFSASNYALLNTVLREEWGWSGVIITDWMASKDNGNASMIRAQNDVAFMGGSVTVNDIDNINLTMAEVQRSVKNIIEAVMKSATYRKENGLSLNKETYTTDLTSNYKSGITIIQTITDKAVLSSLIEQAEIVDKDLYTAESLINLNAVLEEAIVIRDSEYVTQEEIDEIADRLLKALDNLVLIGGSTEPTEPGELVDIKVFIDIESAEVEQGESLQFKAKVETVSKIDTSVTWTILGNASEKTVISEDGLLMVAEDEEVNNVITVTATSNYDLTVSANSQVTIIEKGAGSLINPVNPKTGDYINVVGFIAMFGIAVVVFGIVVNKKRNKSN